MRAQEQQSSDLAFGEWMEELQDVRSVVRWNQQPKPFVPRGFPFVACACLASARLAQGGEWGRPAVVFVVLLLLRLWHSEDGGFACSLEKASFAMAIDSIRELASWPKVPVERQIRQAPQRLPDGPVPSSGCRAARADSYERGERNSGDISQQMRDAFARKRRAQRLKIMPNSLLRTVSPNPNTQATTINKQTNKQINKQIYATSSESVSHPAQNPHSLSPNLSPRSADPC